MALPIEQWYNGGPPKAIICPECTKLIDWPIDNPVGPLCPECGGLISVVSPATNEQPKREPMLSNGEIQAMREVEYKMDGTDIAIIKRYAYLDGAMDARRWFRSKIDSGELMVVPEGKIGRIVDPMEEHQLDCKKCGRCVGFMHVMMTCPGCGNSPKRS